MHSSRHERVATLMRPRELNQRIAENFDTVIGTLEDDAVRPDGEADNSGHLVYTAPAATLGFPELFSLPSPISVRKSNGSDATGVRAPRTPRCRPGCRQPTNASAGMQSER